MTTNPELYHPSRILDGLSLLPNVPDKNVTENIGCFYNERQEIHMTAVRIPKASQGQVIVRIRACGICGSDCAFWKKGRIGNMVVTQMCGAGHEAAGEVIKLGEGVVDFKVGDRVAIEAGIPCGNCEACRTGSYNRCPTVVFFSTPPYHGLLTRFHAHPAAWLHRLPDSLSFEEGALLEPLVVALAAVEKTGLSLGDTLLICGAGPIGLVTLLSAHAAGAIVTITDISESRLAFAKELIPSVRTLLVNPASSVRETADQVKELAGLSQGVACAIDCTGVEASIQTAIYAVKAGATVLVVGCSGDFASLPLAHMAANEIDLKLQFRYANQYPKAIRLVEAGLINLKPLVTHRFSLENSIAAFHTAVDPSSGAIKVQILDLDD